eukprot:Skav203433  [mRNA]  locus=scaffold727:102569:102985:- [translate_table: standard]
MGTKNGTLSYELEESRIVTSSQNFHSCSEGLCIAELHCHCLVELSKGQGVGSLWLIWFCRLISGSEGNLITFFRCLHQEIRVFCHHCLGPVSSNDKFFYTSVAGSMVKIDKCQGKIVHGHGRLGVPIMEAKMKTDIRF